MSSKMCSGDLWARMSRRAAASFSQMNRKRARCPSPNPSKATIKDSRPEHSVPKYIGEPLVQNRRGNLATTIGRGSVSDCRNIADPKAFGFATALRLCGKLFCDRALAEDASKARRFFADAAEAESERTAAPVAACLFLALATDAGINAPLFDAMGRWRLPMRLSFRTALANNMSSQPSSMSARRANFGKSWARYLHRSQPCYANVCAFQVLPHGHIGPCCPKLQVHAGDHILQCCPNNCYTGLSA